MPKSHFWFLEGFGHCALWPSLNKKVHQIRFFKSQNLLFLIILCDSIHIGDSRFESEWFLGILVQEKYWVFFGTYDLCKEMVLRWPIFKIFLWPCFKCLAPKSDINWTIHTWTWCTNSILGSKLIFKYILKAFFSAGKITQIRQLN